MLELHIQIQYFSIQKIEKLVFLFYIYKIYTEFQNTF